jgi:hypothetical protein
MQEPWPRRVLLGEGEGLDPAARRRQPRRITGLEDRSETSPLFVEAEADSGDVELLGDLVEGRENIGAGEPRVCHDDDRGAPVTPAGCRIENDRTGLVEQLVSRSGDRPPELGPTRVETMRVLQARLHCVPPG